MAFSQALNEFAFGTPASTQQIQKFSPEQQQLMNQIGQQSFRGLQGTNLDYAPIAEKIKKEYATKTVPNLLAQFQSGSGGGNPYASSALASILQGGEADLAERLAAGESGYNLNKFNTLLKGLDVGLQPQFESARFSAEPGAAQEFAPYAAKELLKYLLSPSAGKETESSTGQATAQQGDESGIWDKVQQLLAWIAGAAGPAIGSAVGGPAGGVIGSVAGNAASQFLTPKQASYQAATGQRVQQSPFEPKPTLQELMHQSRTGQVPIKAPFTRPFGG